MAPSNGWMRVVPVAAMVALRRGSPGLGRRDAEAHRVARALDRADGARCAPNPAGLASPGGRPSAPGPIEGLALSHRSSGSCRSHLAPRLDRQFGRMARYDALPTQGGALASFALFEAVTAEARHRASRGLRRALRDWALEVSPIGELAARVAGAAPSKLGGRGVARRAFGLEAAHGLPVLEIRHRHGSGLVRVGLAGYGAVRVDLSHARFVRTRVNAEWDLGDDEGSRELPLRVLTARRGHGPSSVPSSLRNSTRGDPSGRPAVGSFVADSHVSSLGSSASIRAHSSAAWGGTAPSARRARARSRGRCARSPRRRPDRPCAASRAPAGRDRRSRRGASAITSPTPARKRKGLQVPGDLRGLLGDQPEVTQVLLASRRGIGHAVLEVALDEGHRPVTKFPSAFTSSPLFARDEVVEVEGRPMALRSDRGQVVAQRIGVEPPPYSSIQIAVRALADLLLLGPGDLMFRNALATTCHGSSKLPSAISIAGQISA